MSDCPHCEWQYDQYAACKLARPTGEAMPLLYAEGQLRIAWGSEAPKAKPSAIAAHLCFEHPMDPEVLRFGPIEPWYPLAPLVRLLGF